MRKRAHFRERYRTILYFTSIIYLVTTFLTLIPLSVLVAWPEEGRHAPGFLLPAFLLLGLGLLGMRIFRAGAHETPTIQEGGVIVLISWLSAFFVSTIPFVWIEGLDFTRALFESVSGWTTTGLSVLDVTQAAKMTLLWRSVMQLAGGAGLAIIMLAALTGPTGPGLTAAEGRTEQLVPHFLRSARLVTLIYSGYTVLGVAGYRLLGMSFFDAVNHSFAAVSTGGFSTRPESIGYWDSPAIEAFSLLLMLLGNLSFISAYSLFQGRFRAVGKSGEVRTLGWLALVGFVAMLLLMSRELYAPLAKGIRVALFETLSALTTTGFSTVGYANWNPFGIIVLFAYMLIGGGAYSTAGGMKQYRVYVLARHIVWEMRRGLLSKRAVVQNSIWLGNEPIYVSDAYVRQIAIYVFLYLTAFLLGAATLAATGVPVKEAFFEFASAIGTVGLSVGVTHAGASPVVLWAEIVGMFLGRLEFFVIFISAAKVTRDLFACLNDRREQAA